MRALVLALLLLASPALGDAPAKPSRRRLTAAQVVAARYRFLATHEADLEGAAQQANDDQPAEAFARQRARHEATRGQAW